MRLPVVTEKMLTGTITAAVLIVFLFTPLVYITLLGDVPAAERLAMIIAAFS